MEKIKAAKIVLHRYKSHNISGGYTTSEITGHDVWGDANRTLRNWSEECPPPMDSYHLCRYEIIFEDSKEMDGHFPLKSLPVENPDLGAHIIRHTKTYIDDKIRSGEHLGSHKLLNPDLALAGIATKILATYEIL